MPSLDEVVAAFASHAAMWTNGRPGHIYGSLFTLLAEEPSLAAIGTGAREGQNVALLVAGAVQFLVLADPSEPLAAFFDGSRSDDDPVPALRSFVSRHRADLERIVAARMVQTNEPGRAAPLVLALGVVASQAAAPIALLEPGCSAGLNLLLDRYAYDFGIARLGGSSELTLRCEIRGEISPPIPDEMPPIAWRAGLDLDPPDLTDDEDVRWLRALIWPGDVERIANHERAIAVARRTPPASPTPARAGRRSCGWLPSRTAEAPSASSRTAIRTAAGSNGSGAPTPFKRPRLGA